MKKLIYMLLGLLFFTGCSNPSIMNVKAKELHILTEKSVIYIPRFEGKPDFVEESTDYFVSILESKLPNNIIQGSSIKEERSDIHSGGNLPQLNIALQYAKNANAEILIMGKVTSHSSGGAMNGFSTVRIYNVKNGNRIANFHQPSGLLFAYSEHQCVMQAVKITAENTVDIIK